MKSEKNKNLLWKKSHTEARELAKSEIKFRAHVLAENYGYNSLVKGLSPRD